MGPRSKTGVLLMAAALLAGDLSWQNPHNRPATRKRSQKGRKRGFKARPKKGHK